MKQPLRLLCILLLAPAFLSTSASAQPAGDKQINPYHQRYADSLKTMEYKPPFPLLARKAYKKGFDIPLPYGVGVTYFYARQAIDITSTRIGFNGGEMIDLTGKIVYGDVENTTNVFTTRADLWVLPFLNIYAVYGIGSSSVTVPLVEPAVFTTKQDFQLQSYGFGATAAAGLGPVFFTLDYNISWAKLAVVDKAVPASTLDMRIGHNFISARHPERGVTIWMGAFMQNIRSSTEGHIAMSSVISPDQVADIDAKIDASTKFTPAEKAILKDAVNNLETSTVDYQLDKRIAAPWNMILGVQYQHNKHWQGRVEIGTFGKRTQFMLNLNYRFQ